MLDTLSTTVNGKPDCAWTMPLTRHPPSTARSTDDDSRGAGIDQGVGLGGVAVGLSTHRHDQALVERAHDRLAGAELHEERANDRGDDADRADCERQQVRIVCFSESYLPGMRGYDALAAPDQTAMNRAIEAGGELACWPAVAGAEVPEPPPGPFVQLAAGGGDLVSMARPLLADPDWARKVRAGFVPSAALAAVVGAKAQPRTEVTKNIWNYIKKNKLQDSKNRRMINADEKLKDVFGGKKQVSMFEMTKLVNKHLK
mgnify:CR=1 FL=1